MSDASGLPPHVSGTAVTVGTFDGVHRGHRHVLARLADRAREAGLASVLVTFEPHPLAVVNPGKAPPLLSTADEKLALLAETGLDYAAILPFTETLRRYSAEQFVELLRQRFRMRSLLIGHDHGLGRGRTGDVRVLRRLGARAEFAVEVVPAVRLEDGRPVSSTLVREAVGSGDLALAAAALGRAYALSGRVVRGEARGRLLGYPTLNIEPPPPPKLLPPPGVYAVRAQTPFGAFGGMMNLGGRPTFGDERTSLEVHLFDAAGDWYGALVRVDLVERLRETRRFTGADELVAQLRRDEENARAALTRLPVPSNL